jgi:Protein of unknown function (DUF1553)/Protein of unknown function (DUF1549)/Planctomycete cytochrome C
MMRLFLSLVSTSALLGTVRAEDSKGVDFFEAKIRPVLTEHCLSCHSADAEQKKKLKGNLRLDSREALLAGGDSGPAVVVGKPLESLLLKSLHYGDLKMPPKGKLPANVIADFETWIAMGLPDPRTTKAGPKKQIGLSLEEGRKFWAYQPLNTPPAPSVSRGDWARQPLDAFVLAKLDAAKISPAPDADRATLIRRLSFDLIGLPPTPAEVGAFVNDADPKALEKLVDRLLAMPEFGERWGRHWLDVARFAESVTLRGFVFREAWRYRDYVIDSFNRDVPYDRFLREQIAGDLMPTADLEAKRRQRIATTYLVLGNTNLEEQDKKQLRMDVVDEQLDAITRGLLGQTVTCARCHDHKFDPIPTRDYYALAGILRNAKAMEHSNVSNWVEVNLPLDAAEEEKYRKHESEISALQARIKSVKGKVAAAPSGAKGIVAVASLAGVVVDDAAARKVGDWQVSQFSNNYIGTGYVHDQDKGKGEKTLTFQPENLPPGRYDVRLAYSSGNSRAGNVSVTVHGADGEKEIEVDMRKSPTIDGRFVSLGEFRFEKNGIAYVLISNEGTKGHVTADAVVFVPLDKPEVPRKAEKPGDSRGESAEADSLKAMESQLKKLQDAMPKRPKVMTVVEEAKIEETKVHIRGSVHTLGEVAPRGFLQVVPVRNPPKVSPTSSGRLELAEWIASKDNPLTSRVMANRVWHWMFGSGIVRTTDNFGTTGELPSNPELLEHLATTFLDDGWSVKKLIRRIALSRTYALSAKSDTKLDPENLLFGRANRRRLDAECIRDAMLAVSGQLSADRGGPTFPATLTADYNFAATSTKRSVYLPAFRNSRDELLEVFDGPDQSMVTGRRNISTVAPQALYMLNHPFPAELARRTAAKLLAEKHADDAARLTALYRQLLGRAPTDGERAIAVKFLQGRDPQAAYALLVQALFASAEFRMVD